MASFVRGDVIVVPFPFSEADGSKRRPAVVLASWARGGKDDYLVCIITSQFSADPFLIELDAGDVAGGALAQKSYLRPTYLYTPASRVSCVASAFCGLTKYEPLSKPL